MNTCDVKEIDVDMVFTYVNMLIDYYISRLLSLKYDFYLLCKVK